MQWRPLFVWWMNRSPSLLLANCADSSTPGLVCYRTILDLCCPWHVQWADIPPSSIWGTWTNLNTFLLLGSNAKSTRISTCRSGTPVTIPSVAVIWLGSNLVPAILWAQPAQTLEIVLLHQYHLLADIQRYCYVGTLNSLVCDVAVFLKKWIRIRRLVTFSKMVEGELGRLWV